MDKAFLFLSLATLSAAQSDHPINKRVLPTNENCVPEAEVCRKGDWIAKHIADCEYDRSLLHPFSCDATNDHWVSWTVDVAVGDRCIPSSDKHFTCGASGTNTRCVCSDTNLAYNPGPNECRCQYWPPEDIGAHSPAFCTGYYTGGTSGVHHWACCNNCNDPTSQSCDGKTWQGGSSGRYCGQCGQNNGGGRVEYYFNCGNCDDQNSCSDFCDSKGLDLAGLCWKWLECFKSCCFYTATQPRSKRSISERSFCGDTVCSGSETPSSCPADCCYQVNSKNCTSGSACSPECCQSPTCCLEEDDNHGGNNKAIAIGVGVGVGVGIIILIVIVTTTLAGVACYRKKRHAYTSM